MATTKKIKTTTKSEATGATAASTRLRGVAGATTTTGLSSTQGTGQEGAYDVVEEITTLPGYYQEESMTFESFRRQIETISRRTEQVVSAALAEVEEQRQAMYREIESQKRQLNREKQTLVKYVSDEEERIQRYARQEEERLIRKQKKRS